MCRYIYIYIHIHIYIVPRGVRVHVVLEEVLPEPALAAEADRVEGEVRPVPVLRLVHPVVAEGAWRW